MPNKAKDEATHELEDLEVREVSVVDRPAIGRRFLIVKRQTEENMPRRAVPATERENHWTDPIVKGDEDTDIIATLGGEDGGDAIDLLTIAEEAVDQTEPPPQEDIPALAQIFKALTAGDASKRVNGLVAGMTRAVSALEGLGDKPASPAINSAFKAVAQGLALMSGDKADEPKETKKGADALAAAKAALGKLTALANSLKGMDASAEIDDKVLGQMKAISTSVAGLISQPDDKAKDDKKDDQKAKEEDDKKKQTEKSDPDPIVVFKAGAKMRRARLSRFRKAVETLSMLLKELEGGDVEPPDPKKDKDKDKKKTTKSEDGLETVIKATEDLASQVEKMSSALVEKVDALAKRVDEIEGVRPTGEGDDDPPEEKVEKTGGLWGNVLGTV